MKTIEEFCSEYSKYPTGNVCDANNKQGSMDGGIKPIDQGMTITGPAFTVECSPGDNLAIHNAIYQAPGGSILVVDAKGYDAGHLGEILASACIKRGIKGVIIDGGCRDSIEIKNLGFPVFARTLNPGGTIKKDKGRLGTVISCGGLRVVSGDFIVADSDGVVVIEKDKIDEVLERTKTIAAREEEVLKMIEKGKTTLEIFDLKKLL